MQYEVIPGKEISGWNKKLKKSSASFFQYPYYANGYKFLALCKPVYLQIKENDPVAFCAIMEIGFPFFKIGLVIRGPVILKPGASVPDILDSIKKFARKKGYIFLRINPNENTVETFLKDDTDFIQADYFPLYKGSQGKDFIVSTIPEDKLLPSYNQSCRQKIKYAARLPFQFTKIQTDKELKEVYQLFEEVGRMKNFKYRPYKSYLSVFSEGHAENLCDVYTAKLNNKLYCAALIVKDRDSYNNLSSALIVGDFDSHASPASQVQYNIMKDCFYTEQKPSYNISYSGPESSVYQFKASFRPVEELKPLTYTYIINKRLSEWLYKIQQKKLSSLKNKFRTFTKKFS